MSKKEGIMKGLGFFVDLLRAFVGGIIFVAFLTFLWPSLVEMRNQIATTGAMMLLDPAFMNFAGTILILSMLASMITWVIPKPS